MITKKDLKKIDYLHHEIDYIKKKIADYKPAKVVRDSTRGSSAQFPYTEHTMTIEGMENKKDYLTEYYDKLYRFKFKLQEEIKRIETDIEEIEDSKIRQIIRYRYFDKMTWNEVADELSKENDKIMSEDSVRMLLNRFLEE